VERSPVCSPDNHAFRRRTPTLRAGPDWGIRCSTGTWSSSPPAPATTVLATASDLRVFFGVVDKEPEAVMTADVVLAFMAARCRPRCDAGVVRLADGVTSLEGTDSPCGFGPPRPPTSTT
jgi:hypothetical protein